MSSKRYYQMTRNPGACRREESTGREEAAGHAGLLLALELRGGPLCQRGERGG